MSVPYSFHEVALFELNEAAAYYDTEHLGLGHQFLDRVVHAVRHVCQHPESCAVVRGRTRKMLVDGFPYWVVYSLVDGHVRVLAIAHQRRRPFYWSEPPRL
jgi:plasmid stabilization system protein ParE